VLPDRVPLLRTAIETGEDQNLDDRETMDISRETENGAGRTTGMIVDPVEVAQEMHHILRMTGKRSGIAIGRDIKMGMAMDL
jgi:hypothetical protein